MDIRDPKAENLMISIWNGKESSKCDGNFFGFSSLAFILDTKTKRVTKDKYSLINIITNFYKTNLDVDYWF